MPRGSRHILDRRAETLAGMLDHAVEGLAEALAPKGEDKPFHEHVDLKWWRDNLNTPAGQQAMQSLQPVDAFTLRRKLAKLEDAQQQDAMQPGDVPNGGVEYGG